jgi:hypothetical protein
MRSITGVIACCFLLLGAWHEAPAQTFYGGLRGVVRDANGIIPGAEVTLTSATTNAVRKAVTSSVGEYNFSNVIPGRYVMTVTFAGYKTKELSDVTVGTNQFHVIDVLLEVGEFAESITVTGETPIIETATASVSSSLDKETMQIIPTVARNPFFMSITTPGVIPSGDSFFIRMQDQTNASLLSLGGGPRRGNNYTLDGVPITDMRNRAVINPSIEAIEEVKVQVHTYDAEMGRTGGGVFNTIHRSGSNVFHGSALLQHRSTATTGKTFFAKRQNLAKPDEWYYLWAGSFGGPIIRDRTFFWFATESYKSELSGGSANLVLPTERERRGDFSQSPFTVYDPLTTRPDPNNPGQFIRDPFPGNVIPDNRINPVSRAMLQFLPLPDAGTRNRSVNGFLDDFTKQWSLNGLHRFSDNVSLSATYMWYDSAEPETRFYRDIIDNTSGDPDEGRLFRTVNVLAINNTWIPSDTSVITFRYGYTTFEDDCVPLAFDTGTLGFSPNFLSLLDQNNLLRKFPRITATGYAAGTNLLGSRGIFENLWYSHNGNFTYSKFLGNHTIKFGGDYRRIGTENFLAGQTSGVFDFTVGFTQGPNPNRAAARTGDAFASFLLGYPSSGQIQIATPNNFFIDYYGGFVQDDWRVGNVVINLGLRYEFEQGLREVNNNFTVGFDRDRPWPVQNVPGITVRGGLMYAGVDGYPTHQSDPSTKKLSPRVGFAWTMDKTTVIRGGYGLFWAPHQYVAPGTTSFGTRGFTAITPLTSTFDEGLTPAVTLTDPFPRSLFPNGLEQPVGSRDGLMTGAGGNIDFIDQFRESAYVHQYSIDLQRELPGRMSVSVGYIGARSERLGIGGTADRTVNINQLDPRHFALGAALQEQVPNPFFGIPGFGVFSTRRTLARGQLLRPYPQFGNVIAHQVSAGKARYHSAVFRWERKIHQGWGARVNYTWSQAKDNLLETNAFSDSAERGLLLNNYDLEGEYSLSLLDAPHRLNVSAVYELPFGKDRAWGGWSISVVGAMQSGFPVNVYQDDNNSGLFGSGQRPNTVSGVDPATSGSDEDRINAWFNPAAWTAAPGFTFGNAPRTDGRARTPSRAKYWDFAFQKSQSIGGNKSLIFRAELLNAFDEPDLRSPDVRFGNVRFGRITGVRGFPRMWQFMIKLVF